MRQIERSKVLYAALAVAFILFIVTKSIFFALLCTGIILILLAIETLTGAASHGIVNELREVIIALLVAAGIWFGLGFLLGTPAPLDAIVSCSMVPNLAAGDLVVLRGVPPGEIAAPEVELTPEQWAKAAGDAGAFYYVCGLCRNGTPCLGNPFVGGEAANADVAYHCGTCTRRDARGTLTTAVCAQGVTIYGTQIAENLTNDVIVYDAPRITIIHRVFAKIKVGDDYYYLTKGDNNNLFDAQGYRFIVPNSRLKGKVIVRIPYLGYFKMFISGMFTPGGLCDAPIVRP